MGAEPTDSDCTCKAGRVAERRGIEPTLSDIEARWRDQSGSLRSLAADFNRHVLRSALETNGHVPLEGEAANLYRLLTDDDVSGGMRTQARNRLAAHGVDVESLEGAFVSYQTVNRHLQGCRGLTADESDGLSVDAAGDRLFALRDRTSAVTEETISQLARADAIDVGSVEVVVDIGVTCTACRSQFTIAELLSRGTCRCSSP